MFSIMTANRFTNMFTKRIARISDISDALAPIPSAFMTWSTSGRKRRSTMSSPHAHSQPHLEDDLWLIVDAMPQFLQFLNRLKRRGTVEHPVVPFAVTSSCRHADGERRDLIQPFVIRRRVRRQRCAGKEPSPNQLILFIYISICVLYTIYIYIIITMNILGVRHEPNH